MIIEIVAGLFGLMGIGYLYAGYTAMGLLLLIGWWVIIGILAALLFVFTLITLGIGSLAVFCFAPLWFLAPIVSGLILKNKMSN